MDDCARASPSTCTIIYGEGTESSGERRIVVESAEAFDEQGVKDMVESSRKYPKPRDCQKKVRKTRPHGFYYWPIFRGDKVVECTLLRKMNLTAWRVLSHRASDTILTKLMKQERMHRKDLTRWNAQLKKKLVKAEETSARLKKAAERNGQGRNCGTKEKKVVVLAEKV